jgi:hypothetical protein
MTPYLTHSQLLIGLTEHVTMARIRFSSKGAAPCPADHKSVSSGDSKSPDLILEVLVLSGLFPVKPGNKAALIESFHERRIDDKVRVGLFSLRILER